MAAYLVERARVLSGEGKQVEAVLLLAEAHLLRDRADGLTSANHSRTVKGKMVGAQAKEQDWRKPPSLREVAKMLGCTQGFLSQARAGTTRIRLSWAERIAAVRPDLPATKKTWPKGWAPEQG
jgi:hypothetical protein